MVFQKMVSEFGNQFKGHQLVCPRAGDIPCVQARWQSTCMFPVHTLHLATVTSISFISLISLKWRWRSQTRTQGKHCSPQPTSGPQEKVPQGSSTSDLPSKTMALKTPGPSTGAQGCGLCDRDASMAWNPDTTCEWMVQALPVPEPRCTLQPARSWATLASLWGSALFSADHWASDCHCRNVTTDGGQLRIPRLCDNSSYWEYSSSSPWWGLMRPHLAQLCNFCTPLWWLCNGKGGYLLSFPFLTAPSWPRHTSDSSKADNNRTTSKSLS